LVEGIGLALDILGDRMFMTDLGGSLYTAESAVIVAFSGKRKASRCASKA
jgi:hypothetical protein